MVNSKLNAVIIPRIDDFKAGMPGRTDYRRKARYTHKLHQARLGMIPGDANATYWNHDLGELWP
jgi:hypothetical protein